MRLPPSSTDRHCKHSLEVFGLEGGEDGHQSGRKWIAVCKSVQETGLIYSMNLLATLPF